MIKQFALSCRCALLGTLTLLTAALPASADPTLIYSTYLGGSNRDEGWAVAARDGRTFIAGTTYSLDFPVKFLAGTGLSSSKPSGDEYTRDIFVVHLGPSGTPTYSTYVQTGVNHNGVLGIGADPQGSAYLASVTYFGADTATTIVKLESWGKVAWSREIYGGRMYPNDMTVDSQGNVYITGFDNHEDSNYQYVQQAFVWKINNDGSFGYGAVIDGNSFESGYGIAVDSGGNTYVTGITLSTNLPNALQAVPVGGYNVFLTKLGPDGSVHWSTYLGGSGDDWGEEIAVAADGTVVLAGTTTSPNFPTLNAIQTSLHGPKDLFVARFQHWGSRISSTYLGGTGSEEVRDLALEPSSILLAVTSPEADSPLREPLDPSCGDSFVAKLDAAASRVLDAACLGDSSVSGVAADSSGISVTGTAGSGLPVVNAWQPSPAGSSEAFAAKLTLNHPPDCAAAIASPNTLWPANGSFVSVSIHGVTDHDGDPVSLALTSIFQDEFYTSPGTPDATGLGTSTARLRASRLNGGNGRVYHLRFTATDSRGGACNGLVKVCVPIQQGGTCIDGGARVDSTRAY